MNIRGFELAEPPRRGGMAMVYKGSKGTLVKAFKLLQPDKVANNPKLSSMFLNEISVQSQLNHPNIVNIHDAYPYQMGDGRTVTVLEMEWLEGMDLQSFIDKRNGGHGLKPETVKRIALQVCRGMQHAHSKNILHLDLKPSNLFRTFSGDIKIIDFGIAKVVGDNATIVEGAERVTMMTTTGQTTFKGTLAFSSPEQQVGGKLTFASDIFSFGQTLHFLLTGSTDPDVTVNDPLFGPIIDKCTQQAPKKRYQNFQEVEEAIEKPQQTKCSNPACGRMLDTAFKVCPYCGTPVEKPKPEPPQPSLISCPNCHKLTNKNFKYCTNCGHRLTEQKTTITCPNPECGKKIWLRADGMTKFCIHCGQELNL
jgi:non-specific serine/threonine protein kinase